MLTGGILYVSTNPEEQMTVTFSGLETERVNPATMDIDRLSPLEIVQVMNSEDAKVAQAIQHELPHVARAIEAIAARMQRGGRLLYFGAGTSGRLGALDAAECPPTFNLPEESVVGSIAGGSFALWQSVEDLEDSIEAGSADAERLDITEVDTVVGIAASGRTPYVLGAIACAKARQALTIGIACNNQTPLAAEVEIMITPLVGPEVISGSTRLKAGTAQKMVLNMLSTGTMILLGKTFGNLMVDVQPTNLKLRRRAVTIVQQATGLDTASAEALLEAADGEVKTAILVGRGHVAPQLAREQLAKHGDILRTALEALE